MKIRLKNTVYLSKPITFMQLRRVFCTVPGQFQWRVFPLPNFEKHWVKKPSHYNHLYVPAKRHVLFQTGFIFASKFAVPQLNSLPLSVHSPCGLLLLKQENCYTVLLWLWSFSMCTTGYTESTRVSSVGSELPSNLEDCLTLEEGTNTSYRNVGKKLPIYDA
jgi:hypothetical protein